jgi:hypothetical protein
MVNREAYVDGQSVGIDPEYDANTIPLRVGTIIWKSGLKIGYYWQMILLLSPIRLRK